MKIGIAASSNPGFVLPLDEALRFSGIAAGICYMPDNLDALFSEPVEKTMKRIKGCIKSGHHSVADHIVFSLALEEIPKILAMVLNNEKMYTTSEKSARYTHMSAGPQEEALYEKWIEIYNSLILKAYPQIDPKKSKKLAMENARYLISVFTPSTSMLYTVSLRQINLIIHWMKKYITKTENNDNFVCKLKDVFRDFLKTPISNGAMKLEDLQIPGLHDGAKNRTLSLFSAAGFRKNEFGENYCNSYLASFAQLAQAQRHRTIKYEMIMVEKHSCKQYFIPPIIVGTEYEKEWINDINSLSFLYPQGRLVWVNERGTLEDFILKCTERLCGEAQLEIANQTKLTLNTYVANVKSNRPELYTRLLPYTNGSRCTFPDWNCTRPCIFGPKNALNRII